MNSLTRWFKKHFIPHAGNDNRPHILRDKSTRIILSIVVLLEIFSFLIPAISQINFSGGLAAVLPAVLDDLTNVQRQQENLPALKVNPILNLAAQMKANDMATLGYFAHTSPQGITPWYWIQKAGYKYQYAGENLAINFSDSQDVTNAWMNSPTHRANIVKGQYTEIGTGVATGIYQGRQTVFVAQVYANPLPVPVKPTVTKTTTPVKTTTTKTVATKTTTTPKVAVKTPPVKVAAITEKESVNILGAETNDANQTVTTAVATPAPQPTFWQKILASPRNSTNNALKIIFVFVGAALLMYLLIQIKHHHLDLITNGLVTLAVIGAVIVTNHYVSYHNMVTSDSIDYSSDTK